MTRRRSAGARAIVSWVLPARAFTATGILRVVEP